MGIAQSDVQYKAWKGEGDDFKDEGPFADLRAVFSLHAEPFTVVARDDSGISAFDDLKGKRVNVGNPGSGQRSTMEVRDGSARAGPWPTSRSPPSSSRPSRRRRCRQPDRRDRVHGRPSERRDPGGHDHVDAHLVPVTGPEIDALVKEFPYYSKAVIPGGMYRGTDRDVETFGVRATVVTSAKAPDDVGLPGGQGGVRELRRVQEAAPRLRQPEEGGDGHPGAVGAAAPGRREVLQGSRPDVDLPARQEIASGDRQDRERPQARDRRHGRDRRAECRGNSGSPRNTRFRPAGVRTMIGLQTGRRVADAAPVRLYFKERMGRPAASPAPMLRLQRRRSPSPGAGNGHRRGRWRLTGRTTPHVSQRPGADRPVRQALLAQGPADRDLLVRDLRGQAVPDRGGAGLRPAGGRRVPSRGL